MSYDLIIFDDDMDVHSPEHFKILSHRHTLFIGFSRHRKYRLLKHARSNNMILRRLHKVLVAFKVVRRKKNIKVLVYDDILSLLILTLFSSNKVDIRITHLKDLEVMPKWYQNVVYLLLRTTQTKVFVISFLMQRYLSIHYKVKTTILPSMTLAPPADLMTLDMSCKEDLIVYSGTLKNRGGVDHFIEMCIFLKTKSMINAAVLLTPEISQHVFEHILNVLKEHGIAAKVAIAPSFREITDYYRRAKFGFAFYDIASNNILRQNFPLKTLEYIAYGVLPIVNPIHAHRYLIKQGYRLLKTKLRQCVLEDTGILDEELTALQLSNVSLASKDKRLFFIQPTEDPDNIA